MMGGENDDVFDEKPLEDLAKRKTLRLGVGAIAVLAGCSSSQDGSPEDASTYTSTDTPTTEKSTEPPRTEETAEVTDGEKETQTPTENQESEPAVEEPSKVPTHTVERVDDVGYAGVARYEVHIRIEQNIRNLPKEDFVRISKYRVNQMTAEEPVNAIAMTFWGENQIIGSEAAYVTVEWAPEGEWGEAGSVDTGDYSAHAFSIDGSSDFEIVSFDGPDSVEIGEEFELTLKVINHSIVTKDFSVYITKDNDEAFQEITATMNPDEQATFTTKKITIGSIPILEEVTFSLEGRYTGFNQKEIEIEPAKLSVGDTFRSSAEGFEILVDEVVRGEVDDIFEGKRSFHTHIVSTNISEETKQPPGGFEFVANSESYSLLLSDYKKEYESLTDVPPGETIDGWLSENLPKNTKRSDVSVRHTNSGVDGEIIASWDL